jgi:hypothetical protein
MERALPNDDKDQRTTVLFTLDIIRATHNEGTFVSLYGAGKIVQQATNPIQACVVNNIVPLIGLILQRRTNFSVSCTLPLLCSINDEKRTSSTVSRRGKRKIRQDEAYKIQIL